MKHQRAFPNGISLSGIVVTFNDDRHLEECLSALTFCDELIVVDLGSKDKSVQIGERLGARIVHHDWVPAVEHVRAFAVAQAKHDWVVFMDPDLIFPTSLKSLAQDRIQQDPSLGVVYIPYRNFFMDHPVRHGRWGGKTAYPAIFRRDAIEFGKLAHRGMQRRPSFNAITLGDTETDILKHYWVDSYEHIYRKHKRYFALEAQARYESGEHFSYIRLIIAVPQAVFSSLFLKRGFLDGWLGLYLSFFNGWWTWSYLLSLRDYERHLGKAAIRPHRIGSRASRMFLASSWLILRRIGCTFKSTRLAKQPTQTIDLAGDRDIEWSWVVAHMPTGPGEALDFGPGGSSLGLAAVQRSFNVTAVDLAQVQWPYSHPRLRFIKGDILRLPLLKERYDLVINCSTVEHVGLAGRYDVTDSRPEGDLETMARLRELLKPGGTMLLTIPVGQDTTFAPLHRVYGSQRLPRLLDGYVVDREEYWTKNDRNEWTLTSKQDALARQPQERLYGLGCFVLRRP